MAEKTLEQRVAALEEQMGGKTLEQQFRAQAELIDWRFDEFEKRQDAKWDGRLDAKLVAFEKRQDAKWDGRLDAKLVAFGKRQDAKWDQRFVALEELAKTILARLS